MHASILLRPSHLIPSHPRLRPRSTQAKARPTFPPYRRLFLQAYQCQDREHLGEVVAALARHPESHERQGSERRLGSVHEGRGRGVNRLGLRRRSDGRHLEKNTRDANHRKKQSDHHTREKGHTDARTSSRGGGTKRVGHTELYIKVPTAAGGIETKT